LESDFVTILPPGLQLFVPIISGLPVIPPETGSSLIEGALSTVACSPHLLILL
jgi:hypothetical protein